MSKSEKPTAKEDDSTVEQLLDHLQAMRSAIPVNLELKQALKQQLVAREQEGPPGQAVTDEADHAPAKSSVGWWRVAGWTALAALIASLIVIGLLFFIS